MVTVVKLFDNILTFAFVHQMHFPKKISSLFHVYKSNYAVKISL